MRRTITAVAVAALVLGTWALPAAAQETSTTEGPAPEPVPISEVVPISAPSTEPAEPAPAPEEPAADQPWTTRFLYPLLVVLTVVLVGGVVLYWVIGIKRRYRVVEG